MINKKSKGSTLIETLLLLPIWAGAVSLLAGLPWLYSTYLDLSADVYLQSRAQVYGVSNGCSTTHLANKYPGYIRFEIDCPRVGCTELKINAFNFSFKLKSALDRTCRWL